MVENSINIYPNKAIVNFEGKNFLGQIGIDSRIFSALQGAGISVGVISQHLFWLIKLKLKMQ